MSTDDMLDRATGSDRANDSPHDFHDPDDASGAQRWLHARVAELERELSGIRRRQVDALAGEPVTDGDRHPHVDGVHREVLERLPTPLVVLSADNVVLYANRAAGRFFGVSFGAAGQTTLGRIVGEGPAARLETLHPDAGPAHGSIDAPDGAGPVRCHAFDVPLAGDVVRGVQIDWDPEGGRAG